jgi:hypothetical protein
MLRDLRKKEGFVAVFANPILEDSRDTGSP